MPTSSVASHPCRVGLPSITVIVPALNEKGFIANTVLQLMRQDYPIELLEILVIDGGSTDGTQSIVKDLITCAEVPIKLLHNQDRRSSVARNIGIRESGSEYVLFVDAHVFIPNSQMIFEMASAVRERGVEVLGRPQPLNPPGLGVLQDAIAGVRASPLGHSSESYIYSKCEGDVSPLSVGVMYKRSLFLEHGLFDELFDAAEDVEFNYRLERAGITAFISPKFAIRYYPRQSFSGLFKQMQRYGAGRVHFTRKHPERFRAEIFIPCVTSSFALLLPGLYAASDVLRPALLIISLIAVLIVMVLTHRHVAHSASLLLAPICLVIIHLGLAFGVLKGVLSASTAKLAGDLELTRER